MNKAELQRFFDTPGIISKTILQIKSNECKFAVPLHQSGEEPTLFCGRFVVPGTSWCAHHKGRVLTTRIEMIRKLKMEDKFGLKTLTFLDRVQAS